MEATQRSLETLFADMARVVARFPLPSIAAVCITGYHLFDLHDLWPNDLGAALRLWAALVAAFTWSLVAALTCEARGLDLKTAVVAGAAGSALLALLLWLGPAVDVMVPSLLLGLALLLTLAGYTGRTADQGAFWLFNHQFWVAWALGFVGAVVFAGGVSAIFETLRYLFGLDLGDKLHYRIWSIGLGFIAPMMWLALVPERYDQRVAEGRQVEFTSNAVAILVTYILVPLLFVYAAILHIYALKILVTLDLPKGQIGWMVLTFGAFMTVTALLVYPTRDVCGPHVALYWRVWPWLLAVPVLLLFIAIGIRIADYGVTHDRYLVVLAGVWLSVIVITQGLGLFGRDLRVIPASLAVLLLATAFGPWGISGLPVWWQKSVLLAGLEKVGLIKAGKVVGDGTRKDGLPRAELSRIHSAIDYLRDVERLDVLKSLFAGLAQNPFADDKAKTSGYAFGHEIKERLGLDKEFSTGRRNLYPNFYAKAPYTIEAGSGGRVYGPVYAYPGAASGRGTFDGKALKSSLVKNILELTIDDGEAFRFDLLADATLKASLGDGNGARSTELPPVRLVAERGGERLELLVVGAAARIDDSTVSVNSVQFWLVLQPTVR